MLAQLVQSTNAVTARMTHAHGDSGSAITSNSIAIDAMANLMGLTTYVLDRFLQLKKKARPGINTLYEQASNLTAVSKAYINLDCTDTSTF